MSDNQAQIENWNQRAGEQWASRQAALDRVIGPLGELAIQAARVVPGQRILDVGCGCGDTALSLAALAGPGGLVTGVDISAPMLAQARARVAARSGAGAAIELLEGDASAAPLPSDRDLVFSRFGVMFFADPVKAFSHLRATLREGGRLAFVCWRALSENPWVSELEAAIAPHLPEPAPADPYAPGPFAFSERDRVADLLARAGWKEIVLQRHDRKLTWTQSASLAEAVDFFTHVGAASRRLAEADEPARRAALVALSEVLARHLTPGGVIFDSSVWIVTARG